MAKPTHSYRRPVTSSGLQNEVENKNNLNHIQAMHLTLNTKHNIITKIRMIKYPKTDDNIINNN